MGSEGRNAVCRAHSYIPSAESLAGPGGSYAIISKRVDDLDGRKGRERVRKGEKRRGRNKVKEGEAY